MKKVIAGLLVLVLTGCATNKAVLPSLQGKPRVKINQTIPDQPAAHTKAPNAGRINFSFNGDIMDAAQALKKAQPQLNLLPPLGDPFPFRVSVHLSNATAEEILQAIGEQGGNKVDVVLNKSMAQGGNQVLIRFNTPKE